MSDGQLELSPAKCPVCGHLATALDVVDFNKASGEAQGRRLPPLGIAVYYYLCDACGFCFAPELTRWTRQEFAEYIYNDGYAAVDPLHRHRRPEANAQGLLARFGGSERHIRHLDYGGNGRVSEILSAAGWRSESYDPFADPDRSPRSLGKFNLITAFEVFERMPDPLALFETLHLSLDESGLILFTTLLSDSEIDRQRRLTWWYAAPRNGHISLYARKTLMVLAKRFHFRLGSFHDGFHVLMRQTPEWAKAFAESG